MSGFGGAMAAMLVLGGSMTGPLAAQTAAPTGAPSGVPAGAPAGVPVGVPAGAPAGAPAGVPAGAPTGSPRGAQPRTPFVVAPTGSPSSLGGGFSSSNAPQAPREVPLVEKALESLSNQTLSEDGKKALGIDPVKWKHAETDNFILHYRRGTEAQKVAREVEYDLWYVATVLGATRDQYARKSHVYIFEDAAQWKEFLKISNNPMQWAASYARGDELFLNLRGGGNSGPGASFDSHTLAHETAHAVVARLFPGKRWPLWLNEGFAEYMGGASVAARKGQSGRRFQRDLSKAEMSLAYLETLETYPSDQGQISQLYESSEKFVRFLMNEMPKERIAKFVQATLGGKKMQEAFLEVYSDKCKDWETFEKRYAKFSK